MIQLLKKVIPLCSIVFLPSQYLHLESLAQKVKAIKVPSLLRAN